MNNVLGSITAIASTTLETLPKSTAAHQELGDILSAARRGATLTRNVLSLLGAARLRRRHSHRPRGQGTRVAAAATLPKSISVRVECQAGDSSIQGDAGELGHLLMNLCLNSADAIDERGTIVVSTRLRQLDGTEGAGAGAGSSSRSRSLTMATESPRRSYPGYSNPTFRQVASRTLGFWAVDGLRHGATVPRGQRHRGRLGRHSGQRGLAHAADAFERAEAQGGARPQGQPGENLLLFVDDEPLLRRAGRRMAKSLGFEAVTAVNGQRRPRGILPRTGSDRGRRARRGDAGDERRTVLPGAQKARPGVADRVCLGFRQESRSAGAAVGTADPVRRQAVRARKSGRCPGGRAHGRAPRQSLGRIGQCAIRLRALG